MLENIKYIYETNDPQPLGFSKLSVISISN